MVKRLILKVMEHGLILAMLVGVAAIIALALVSEGTWQRVGFLILGVVGIGLIVGVVWVKRTLTAAAKPSEHGSHS